MRIPALILLSPAIFLLCSISARAQRVSTTTGNDLLESCESTGHFEQAFCFGYITGVTDTDAMDGAAFPDRRRSCVAENVSNGQVKDVVVKYLRDHPEERHLLAAILIVKAMSQAFPCKAK
ncbi:MAG: Rap1a/Tai family immunity protein [Candidatus Acidiferrum sp.]